MTRRASLKHLLGLGALGAGSGLGTALGLIVPSSLAASTDYRAVVCLHLGGGSDGNDMLIPTDGAYLDYANVRKSMAIAKDSLISLSGSSAGHTFAMPPALKDLVPLYNQGRLAMVANVGALVKPTTAAQVLDRSAIVPPFLMSHAEQAAYIQGWMGDTDVSGWAGRAMELMPADLKKVLPVMGFDSNPTLLLGKKSYSSQLTGLINFNDPTSPKLHTIEAMGKIQSANNFETEYARTLGAVFNDAVTLNQVSNNMLTPSNNFPGTQLGTDLRTLASFLPGFKALGARRQVFQVSLGNFDTHAAQRGTDINSLDSSFSNVGSALAAFDTAIKAAGLDQNVVTLVMSEFGRALLPNAGGTDHGWGNNWMVMGGPVMGQQVIGSFPTLTLGGPDDSDFFKKGRWVPTTSSDQVGASLMQWLGLTTDQFALAFPNLTNFTQKTLPLLRT